MNGIYVHIPFCRKKCPYCDFYSITEVSLKESFLYALLKEIKLKKEKKKKYSTLYFGGGTPSLLSTDEVKRIIDEISKNFDTSFIEITIEVNPEDVNFEYLKQLKNAGINRISIGVQSFNNRVLKILGRSHSAQESLKAVKIAKNIFDNISIDLIYGIKGIPLNTWIDTLTIAKELAPHHISVYALSWEKIKEKFPDETFKEYEITEKILSPLYKFYEISNLSLPGYESKHNMIYWERGEYLGFGPSASSFINSTRTTNVKDIKKYIELLNKNMIPIQQKEFIDKTKELEEKIYLGLRTKKGIDKKLIKDEAFLKNLIDEGYAFIQNEKLVLTHKGRFLADRIAVEIINLYK